MLGVLELGLHNTEISCKRRLNKGAREARANGPPLVSCISLFCGLTISMAEPSVEKKARAEDHQ